MNINEIAKMAGVSRATVSRYLNHGYVSEDKRASIQAVIDATGYQPSAQAQTPSAVPLPGSVPYWQSPATRSCWPTQITMKKRN